MSFGTTVPNASCAWPPFAFLSEPEAASSQVRSCDAPQQKTYQLTVESRFCYLDGLGFISGFECCLYHEHVAATCFDQANKREPWFKAVSVTPAPLLAFATTDGSCPTSPSRPAFQASIEQAITQLHPTSLNALALVFSLCDFAAPSKDAPSIRRASPVFRDYSTCMKASSFLLGSVK